MLFPSMAWKKGHSRNELVWKQSLLIFLLKMFYSKVKRDCFLIKSSLECSFFRPLGFRNMQEKLKKRVDVCAISYWRRPFVATFIMSLDVKANIGVNKHFFIHIGILYTRLFTSMAWKKDNSSDDSVWK